MGLENTHRFAALDQQRFVILKAFQGRNDGVIASPITRCFAGSAVNNQVVRLFSYIRIQVVHQHPQRRFLVPAFAVQCGARVGMDRIAGTFLEIFGTHTHLYYLKF